MKIIFCRRQLCGDQFVVVNASSVPKTDVHSGVGKERLVGNLQWGATPAWRRVRLSYTHVVRTREFKTQTGNDQFSAFSLSMPFPEEVSPEQACRAKFHTGRGLRISLNNSNHAMLANPTTTASSKSRPFSGAN